jgi:hypothetical protein
MAALIGALRVSLSAETSAFEAGMRRSQRTANQTAKGIEGAFGKMGGALKAGVAGFLGAITVGGILQMGKAALDYAGSLGEVSQQLGVTTRDLQTFRYAAGQVGVSQTELETGLSKLTVTLGRVAAGAKQPIAALNAIGVSVDQIRGKDTGDAFRIIADGLAKVSDRSQRAAVEMALFGRSGAQLDNLLAGGSAALNELARAADELGIVLSDEQIQKADETADKLEAVKTVLSARIAGVVADNADAILGLANALADVAGAAQTAFRAMQAFYSGVLRSAAKFSSDHPVISRVLFGAEWGKNVRANAFRAGLGPPSKNAFPVPKGAGGGDIPQFLAGGGGRGGGGRRGSGEDLERQRLEALREAHQFDQEMRRAQRDILQSNQSLVTDYRDRAQLALKILDLDRQDYQAELAHRVASKEITAVQAEQLRLAYDEKHDLEAEAIIRDREAQRYEDRVRIQEAGLDAERDLLESQAQLAETAGEERAIRLRILDHLYKQERFRLQAVIDDEKSSHAAREEARIRLANLDKTYGNDQAGVIASTRGPLEQYGADLPTTAAKWEEALQSVAVNGFGALEDAIMGVADGTKTLGDAFREMAQSILSDLIRISIQKAIIAPLMGALFPGGTVGVPSFAGGGGFNVLGRTGIDRNTLSLNGLPIANVSYGERVSISNDNSREGGGIPPFVFNNYAPMTGKQARQTGLQAAHAFRTAVVRSAKVSG